MESNTSYLDPAPKEEPDSLGELKSLLLLRPKEQWTSGRTRQPRIGSYMSAGLTSRQTYSPEYIDVREERTRGERGRRQQLWK